MASGEFRRRIYLDCNTAPAVYFNSGFAEVVIVKYISNIDFLTIPADLKDLSAKKSMEQRKWVFGLNNDSLKVSSNFGYYH